MTKVKRVLLGCIAAIAFAAMPLAYAQSAPGADRSEQGHHYGQKIQEIYSQLGLTADQKKQLEANKQQHRAKMESARRQIKANKEALKEELMKPQLDMPKINALHEQTKALLSQMEDTKLSSILTVRAILTPEQFSRFVSLMRKHRWEHEEK